MTCVEESVSSLLRNKFALFFGGQTTPEAHHVAVFAMFTAGCSLGYNSACLAISPFQDETTQGADEHFTFLEFVLDVFEKSLDSLVAFVGENCNVN